MGKIMELLLNDNIEFIEEIMKCQYVYVDLKKENE